MMIAKVVALSLIPAGAAALGVVSYIQHQPRAFTTDTQVVAIAHPERLVAPPSVAVEPIVEDEPVVLAPLVVAKPTAAKPRAQQAVKAKVPCSGWRALGYEHVDNGAAKGVAKVRELCDPDAPTR
jgi:hypothetical protein